MKEAQDTTDKTTAKTKGTPKKKGTIKCKVCGDIVDKRAYAKHKATHAKDVHKCEICQHEFSTRKYLQRHVRNVHTEKRNKYKCAECDKTFPFLNRLKKHEMVHTGEKPYKCEECGKRFRALYCYKMHMLVHTDEKPFACAFCAYACRDSSTLRKHQASHTGEGPLYQCTKCERTFKAKFLLKVHIAEDHLGLNVRLTECKTCKKMFKSQSRLTAHVKSVHARAKTAKCEICARIISNVANLPAHMLTHSDLRPFKCKEDGCDKMFKTKNDARRHSIVHHSRRKTPCSQCGHRFARVGALRTHELTQHRDKVKDTPCQICGDKFFNENYLLKHIHQKHSTYKEKYICDHCGFETRNKPSIVMHIKHGHGNERDLKCKICKRKYKRHLYLKLHYQKSHNLRYKPIHRKLPRPPELETEVEVKEEPLDIEYHDLEGALENAEVVNAEDFMTVRNEEADDSNSTVELSETLATAIITDNVGALTSIPEEIFDRFFVKHVKDIEKDEEPQPKQESDRDEQESKHEREEREKLLVKERDNAIREAVERSRQNDCDETRQNTVELEEDKDKNIHKSGKRKRNAILYEMLSCNVCGKVCQGLAAFNGHVKSHSEMSEEDSEKMGNDSDSSDNNEVDSEIYKDRSQRRRIHRKVKNNTTSYSEIVEHTSKKKINYSSKRSDVEMLGEVNEDSSERTRSNRNLNNKDNSCSEINRNDRKRIPKNSDLMNKNRSESEIVTHNSESESIKSSQKLKRHNGEGSQPNVSRSNNKDDNKIKNLKEFFDANVKDLGVEFEHFVEICKKVKKNK